VEIHLTLEIRGVDANTHFVVAKLLEQGANVETVNEIERYQRSLFKLQQDVWNNMMYDSVYKIMYVLITRHQIEDNKSSYKEASYIVDIMKLVKDVDVAILFLANGKNVYIKARSNTNVNIAKVMEEIGGGGHINAAGAHCYTDSAYSLMNSVVQKIKNEMDFEKSL
jgi:phosphoesterase RecJ-like protein